MQMSTRARVLYAGSPVSQGSGEARMRKQAGGGQFCATMHCVQEVQAGIWQQTTILRRNVYARVLWNVCCAHLKYGVVNVTCVTVSLNAKQICTLRAAK
eukprot:2361432-Pleurochrysis_carterae.AAC.4